MSNGKKRVRATFRRVVFERDNGKCKMCEATEDLAAHHITDRNKMPNGGYVQDNGITLCPPCHVKAEQYHISNGTKYEKGWSPEDLYAVIGSDYESAFLAARRMDPYNCETSTDASEYEYG
jgi:5-methylcytosine-specific restriction endonuclease McrA